MTEEYWRQTDVVTQEKGVFCPSSKMTRQRASLSVTAVLLPSAGEEVKYSVTIKPL